MLAADAKRLHVFVRILRDGEVLATVEQICLPVDMKAGKTCPAAPEVLALLLPIAQAHQALERPAAAGRFTGQRKA